MRFAAIRLAAILAAAGALCAGEIDPNRYLDHVKYLASPALKGRGTGTPGLETAADYIGKQFRSYGLKPVDGLGYYQRFPVTTNARLGPKNVFDYSENGRKKALKAGQDFVPFNFSASGRTSGEVVFAGYGITAPEYHYDDYDGLDAKGKIVVVLRHEPQEFDDSSVFAGKELTQHAQFWSKAVNAKQHGAAAVVLINDGEHHKGDTDTLEAFGRAAGPVNAGIPFVQVKETVVEKWFSDAGRNLDETAAAIDKDLKPRSFAFPASLHVEEDVDVRHDRKTVRNVVAYLPGQTDEYVIIGAHYDHLGLGEQNSLAPSKVGTPHPGADDNASGTAGVLELARWFADQPKHRRGILFLSFAGEELGLLGSRHWVEDPELPLKNAVAMINLDMIGRVRDRKVYVGGASTGSTFRPLLEKALAGHSLKMDISGTLEAGGSDHQSFIPKQVPVLFFFSGLHSDYHKPSDTWDKIDAPDASDLLRAVADIATTLADEPGRPEFVKPAAQPAGPVAGGGRGYGAWFGSVPDFGEVPNGVRFADVTAGSPAANAGLKAGDILVEFEGKPVQNLYDFTYALRARRPGDVVTVKVLRDGKPVEAKVTLGQRK